MVAESLKVASLDGVLSDVNFVSAIEASSCVRKWPEEYLKGVVLHEEACGCVYQTFSGSREFLLTRSCCCF